MDGISVDSQLDLQGLQDRKRNRFKPGDCSEAAGNKDFCCASCPLQVKMSGLQCAPAAGPLSSLKASPFVADCNRTARGSPKSARCGAAPLQYGLQEQLFVEL